MSVSKSTIIRTVVFAIALLNSVLTMCGLNPLPFSDDEIYEGVSAVVMVVTAIVTWWKNNSFSKAAITADEFLKKLKGQNESEE